MPTTTSEPVATRHAPPPAPKAAAPVRVTFTPEVLAMLREKAGMRNKSVPELVCIAVENYLEEHPAKTAGQAHETKPKKYTLDEARAIVNDMENGHPGEGLVGAIKELSFTPPPGYDWKEDYMRALEEKHAGVR